MVYIGLYGGRGWGETQVPGFNLNPKEIGAMWGSSIWDLKQYLFIYLFAFYTENSLEILGKVDIRISKLLIFAGKKLMRY